MKRESRAAQRALERDFVWALLWRLNEPGWPDAGWATSTHVHRLWLDGREQCGIVFAGDWIGPRDTFTRILNRLVADSRAERRKRPGKHPEYRAIPPKEEVILTCPPMKPTG